MIHLWVLTVPFSFLLRLNLYHPHTFTSPLQQTLKQNHSASHNWQCQKHVEILSIQIAFKWAIAWTRRIRGYVNPVICLYLKIFFVYIFIRIITFAISTSIEKLSLLHLQISLWQPYFVFPLFFFWPERYHLFSQKLQSTKWEIFKVSIKTFCRKSEAKALSKWFFIFRSTSLYVLMFPIFRLKKNLWSYWKR